MLFLSGLLGMMALGSVAIVGTGSFEDEGGTDDYPDDPPGDPYAEDPGAWLAEETPWPDEADGTGDAPWPLPDDAAYEQGRSLFARMGLINLPFAGDDAGMTSPEPVADVLQLEAFAVSAPPDDAEPAEGAGADVLDFDAKDEQLVIVYDDSAGGGEPVLELRVSPDDPGMTEILVDGSALGRLPTDDAPPLSAILMVGESTAAALSLG